MKIVVIGGTGFIGRKLVGALSGSGHDVVAASPKLGVNTITGEGLAGAMTGAQVAVDLSNAAVFDDAGVMDFFERSARNLIAAEKMADVKHHLVLSVVGADRLSDSGYLRAKIAQENSIKSSSIPYTIVRSTQFIEFMDQVAELFNEGGTLRVPTALIQPIVSDELVAALADLILEPATHATLEVAGPETVRLDELIRRVLQAKRDARHVIADAHARYFGAELADTSLIPLHTPYRTGGTTPDEWLARTRHSA
jgi:uncharacterized protein YbjT (DUF2867 family)